MRKLHVAFWQDEHITSNSENGDKKLADNVILFPKKWAEWPGPLEVRCIQPESARKETKLA